MRSARFADGRSLTTLSPMLVALSPYHLTTREPAAAAALLLADQVVTLLPAPLSGMDREQVEQAAERVPRYLDFMLSWQWSVPLWQAGVITSAVEGEDAMPDVRAAHSEIAADERFKSLRSLMKPSLFDAEEAYLEAVAADLLKGGPDPGITVPVAAGMDRFAQRHGMAVARSEPHSVVQKAERELGEPVFAFALPILLQGTAERILTAREILEPELAALRAAIDGQVSGRANGAGRAALMAAAAEYTRAFERSREELTGCDEEDEVRVVEGVVAITGLTLPVDAVLTSSLAAMKTIAPGAAVPRAARPVCGAPGGSALAEGRVLTFIVKVLGRAPAGRR